MRIKPERGASQRPRSSQAAGSSASRGRSASAGGTRRSTSAGGAARRRSASRCGQALACMCKLCCSLPSMPLSHCCPDPLKAGAARPTPTSSRRRRWLRRRRRWRPRRHSWRRGPRGCASGRWASEEWRRQACSHRIGLPSHQILPRPNLQPPQSQLASINDQLRGRLQELQTEAVQIAMASPPVQMQGPSAAGPGLQWPAQQQQQP